MSHNQQPLTKLFNSQKIFMFDSRLCVVYPTIATFRLFAYYIDLFIDKGTETSR